MGLRDMNNFDNDHDSNEPLNGALGETNSHSLNLKNEFLTLARQLQAQGDLAKATHFAREALALDEHDCASHALLGELYSLQGDEAAAHYHFQAALNICEPCAEDNAVMASEIAALIPPPATQSQPGMIMLVLILCILVSGLATLFAFRSTPQSLGEGRVLQLPSAYPPIVAPPPWTWRVPTPVESQPEVVNTPRLPREPSSRTGRTTSYQFAPEQEPVHSAAVLGPSAHARISVPVGRPSITSASEAYERGEYERALSIYETLLAREATPSPRLYQDIAGCHQQLGNMLQAKVNLHHALDGFQQILLDDPANLDARQGVAACELALSQL